MFITLCLDNRDCDARKFCDILGAFSLQNHVWTETQISGHALDLIITRAGNEVLLHIPERRQFISDHAFIRARTMLVKPETEVRKITYRKLKDIDIV